jgi:hypothetical protein
VNIRKINEKPNKVIEIRSKIKRFVNKKIKKNNTAIGINPAGK